MKASLANMDLTTNFTDVNSGFGWLTKGSWNRLID